MLDAICGGSREKISYHRLAPEGHSGQSICAPAKRPKESDLELVRPAADLQKDVEKFESELNNLKTSLAKLMPAQRSVKNSDEDFLDEDVALPREGQLQQDLFTMAWLDLLTPRLFVSLDSHDSCVIRIARSMFKVAFVVALQLGLTFALWQATVQKKDSHFEELKVIFSDVVGNMGSLGLQLLSEVEANEICGEAGDDYNDVENIYSYKKLTGNWNVFQTTHERRGKLEQSIFLLTCVSRYAFLFLCVSVLWFVTLLGEVNNIQLFRKVVLGRKIEFPNKGHYDLGEEALTYDLESCSLARIGGAMIVCVRILVVIFLMGGGCALLISTGDIVDLVLNGVALGFILEIDEVLFRAFASDIVRTTIEKAAIFDLEPTNCQRKCIGWVSETRYVWMLSCSILGVLIMRIVQIMQAQETFFLTASLCLFGGPTPDIGRRFDAAFPVPGFCESLLKLECELPDDWKNEQCLRSQPTNPTRSGCRFYAGPDSPPALFPIYDEKLTSFEWQNATGPVCMIPEGASVFDTLRKRFLGKSFDSTFEVMQDPVGMLRRSCWAMLSQNQEMQIDFSDVRTFTDNHVAINVWLELYEKEGGDPQRLNRSLEKLMSKPQVGIVPFPRMRNFAKGNDKFAAPFACHLKDTVWSLLRDGTQAVQQDKLVSNWHSNAADVLSRCASIPISMQPQGSKSDLCYSPFHCRSDYCDFGHPLESQSKMIAPPPEGTWGQCKRCPTTAETWDLFLDMEDFYDIAEEMYSQASGAKTFQDAKKQANSGDDDGSLCSKMHELSFGSVRDVVVFIARFNDHYVSNLKTPYCYIPYLNVPLGKAPDGLDFSEREAYQQAQNTFWITWFGCLLPESRPMQSMVSNGCKDWTVELFPKGFLAVFFHELSRISITPTVVVNMSQGPKPHTIIYAMTVYVGTWSGGKEGWVGGLPQCEGLRTDLWQAGERNYFVSSEWPLSKSTQFFAPVSAEVLSLVPWLNASFGV